MVLFWGKRKKARVDDAAHEVSLREAEAQLADLTYRGEYAVRTLDKRHRRNGWRESIEQMIQGGST